LLQKCEIIIAVEIFFTLKMHPEDRFEIYRMMYYVGGNELENVN